MPTPNQRFQTNPRTLLTVAATSLANFSAGVVADANKTCGDRNENSDLFNPKTVMTCDFNNVDGHIIGNVPYGSGAVGKLQIEVDKSYSNTSQGCAMFLFYLKLADEALREQAALEGQLTKQERQLAADSEYKFAQSYGCSEQDRYRFALSPMSSCTGYRPDLPPFIGEDETSMMYASDESATYITVPGGTTIPCKVAHATTTTTTTPEETTTSPQSDEGGWIGLGVTGAAAVIGGAIAAGLYVNNKRKHLQQHALEDQLLDESPQSRPSAA